MREPNENPHRPSTTPLLAGLQILGFAGASHLVHRIMTLFASDETLALAEQGGLFSFGGPQDFAAALLWFALVPALTEELLFRGLLFAILQRLRGPGLAIIVSALLFGIAHLDPHHGVVATLLGLQLGLLRYLHGLPLAIAAHFLNNALALAATYLSETEGTGLPPFEAGPISLFLALLFAGSAWAALVHRLRSSASFDLGPGSHLQTLKQRDE